VATDMVLLLKILIVAHSVAGSRILVNRFNSPPSLT